MAIGIFPASGGLGTSTYTHLLKQVPNDQVVLINRHPEKVSKSYVDAGVQVRQASYETSPSELESAFAGVDVLFLISYPSHVHDYRVKVQLPAIDAARRAGVRHIFYSSLGFDGRLEDKSLAVVMQAHLETEHYLACLAEKDSGFTWTSIREGLYTESTPIYTAFFDPRNPADEVLIPHDGSGPGVSWVKRDELGEGTASLIAQYFTSREQFDFVNKKVRFTGTKEWSLTETVQVLADIAGKKDIKIRKITVDEYVKLPQVLDVFGTEEKARSWATAWDGVRAGEAAVVTDDLQQILGRKPEEFDVTAKTYWARFKNGALYESY